MDQHESPLPGGDAALDRERDDAAPAPPDPTALHPVGPRPEVDDRRRRRGGDKRHIGFGDGVERAYCTALQYRPPDAFPVVHRNDAATLRIRLVDRRPGAILLCDGQHGGAHVWPGGETVETRPGGEATED